MSRRTIEFSGFQIGERIEKAKIAWTNEAPLEVLDEAGRGEYDRIFKVLIFVASYFDWVDVDLLPQIDWNDLVQRLANVESYGNQFTATKNIGFVQNANAELDVLLRYVIQVPFRTGGNEGVDIIKDHLTTFTHDVGDMLQTLAGKKNELENAASDLNQKLNALSERYASEEQRISSQVQAHQDQFSQAQEKRQTDYASVKESRQKEFSEAQENRKREFETVKQSCENLAKQSRDSSEAEFSSLRDKLKDEADQLLARMNEIKSATENIYGLVGKESIVGSQKVYADNAKTLAHWLSGSAIVLMLVVAVIVIWPLLVAFTTNSGAASVDWISLACRIPITAVLLLPALYLANEAKKQRAKESRYRELEIKMAAITPYFAEIANSKVADLPEKEKVKIELAKNMLSIRDEKDESGAVFSPDVLELAKIIASTVKK